MKVYILSEYHIERFVGGEENVLGIFDFPKTARKWFEKKYGLKTKGKWTKRGYERFYQFDADTRYYITEWKVKTDKDS